MHQTGLLQQFYFAQLSEEDREDEDDAPEPSTPLKGLSQGEEDNSYEEL